MMNKTIKFFGGMFLMVCFCCVLSGCAYLQNGIREYSSDKEQCHLVSEDVTQFTYKGESYTILNNTVSNDGLGEWLGYIRQLAAVDENGTVLVQEAIETASFETLSDLADKAPNAKYIIPFLNVYAVPNNASQLIVDVNGGYHEAVPSNQLTAEDEVFDFKTAAENTSGSYEANPQNATQLIYGDRIYQVTEETVPKDQLGAYLDILSETVTFDAESKRPLSKEELNKIDWDGTSAGQQRERWFYVGVYEISGTDPADAVAVKVNNQYYIAKVQ